MSNFFSKFRLNLVQRIILGLILGLVLGLLFPRAVWIGTLGGLFVGSLKAIAPLLVFVLVISSLQVVGVGFIIGVIQDSVETALNSSGDAIFTATAEYVHWRKIGKSLPTFLGGKTETKF